MKCVICRQGETHPGSATVTLTREGMTLVVKRVPASVCDNCGEEYLEEEVTADLLELVERSADTGVEVEILEYAGATGS
jgi:YgiT-type zinc finger domain-containing protein